MSRKRCRRVQRIPLNPFIVAQGRATLLTDAERAQCLPPLHSAATRMRQGLSSSDDWSMLVGALLMAQTIEKQRVVRGLAGHLEEIDRALVAIEARATAVGTWQSPTLHFHELDSVALLCDLYKFQLEQLSYGEFRRACDTTTAQVRSRRGQLVLTDGKPT